MEIVRFAGNCRDIDDIAEPCNGGILVDDVFDEVDEPCEFHEGEDCLSRKERIRGIECA